MNAVTPLLDRICRTGGLTGSIATGTNRLGCQNLEYARTGAQNDPAENEGKGTENGPDFQEIGVQGSGKV